MPSGDARAVSTGSEKAIVARPRALERTAAHGGGERRMPSLAPLEPPLLPEVERRQRRGQREAGERRRATSPTCRTRNSVEYVAAPGLRDPAGRGTRPRAARGQRHDDEPEQPVARPAAPDQVRADDEPDEEVERPGPGVPGESVRARGLRDEQRRLHEPADAERPRSQRAERARVARVARVRERRLAVGEQRRPEEQLSQPRLLALGSSRAPARVRSPSSRSSRETFSEMIST